MQKTGAEETTESNGIGPLLILAFEGLRGMAKAST
jgi:hypothetical protein